MTTRQHRHWPKLPQTAIEWMALDELGLGRHLVADIGWVSSRRERAVAAGVTGLPAPPANVDDGLVKLPAVTLVDADGRMQMFRLPLAYLVAIRQLFAHERTASVSASLERRLPCHFLIGDRETIWLRPDGAPGAQRLN